MSSMTFGMKPTANETNLKESWENQPKDYAEDQRFQTKTCPRCGEELFSDMNVCYGCLYDFEHPSIYDVHPQELEENSLTIFGENETSSEELSSLPLAGVAAQNDSLQVADFDDTLVLDKAMSPEKTKGGEYIPRHVLREIVIRTHDIDAHYMVSETGLTLGRSEDNDIVLRMRTISRNHALIFPSKTGISILDKGATNPMKLNGELIKESAHVHVGDVVDLGNAQLFLAAP